MTRQKGSFTIEAVILIPFVLFMMIGVLQQGIDFYESCAENEISQEVEEWDSVSRFYELWMLKEIRENLSNE